MTGEANDGDEKKAQGSELGDIVWGVAGFFAGISLAEKYVKSNGYSMHENLPAWPVLLVIIFMFGPAVIAGMISSQIRGEVEQGKTTWATYWSTTAAIIVAVLAFTDITSVDDIFNLLD